MNIPKKIEKLIDQRCRYAEMVEKIDYELSTWLRKVKKRTEFRHIKINIEFVSWKRSADTMRQRYQHCSRLVVKALVAALRCAVTKF